MRSWSDVSLTLPNAVTWAASVIHWLTIGSRDIGEKDVPVQLARVDSAHKASAENSRSGSCDFATFIADA
jgi:hypothetical protein